MREASERRCRGAFTISWRIAGSSFCPSFEGRPANRKALTRCAMQSAKALTLWVLITATNSKRTLFPDYPRPAIWPDGYYIPTSTGDTVIQKHACVADRTKMLQGLPATEQCIIIDGPNFLNNADIDGTALPPAGAPNIMIAAGASQLRRQFSDDGLYVYKFHVDWETPEKTTVSEPVKIAVAPYHYLCNGQLTSCVPQPGTDRRLDAQGDKIMQRLVYRNVNGRESIVGLHSVNTKAGGGRRAVVRVASGSMARAGVVSARHVCAGWLLSMDGKHGLGSSGQHRYRLFVRRNASFCGTNDLLEGWRGIPWEL